MNSSDVGHLEVFWRSQRGLPPEIDGKLIARCGAELGTNLDSTQKRDVRARFTAAIKATSGS